VTPEPDKDAGSITALNLMRLLQRLGCKVTFMPEDDRADFVFLSKDQLAGRYPGVSLAGLPERGGAGLVIASHDLVATEKALGTKGTRSGASVVVAPASATGTLLAFVAS